MIHHAKRKLQQWDTFLAGYQAWLVLSALVIVLRLPNLFEPYWYGDEGIYLTLGIAMRQGERLYAEIIDHKTPLIYYLAMVPSQFWFRVLNIGWMWATSLLFFQFARQMMSKAVAVLATIVFIVLTTLPWFEGHIPNGELFVLGFVMVGLWLANQTSFFHRFWQADTQDEPTAGWSLPTPVMLLLSGSLFGLGILTKVPALFDFLALLAVVWFSFVNRLQFKKPLASLLKVSPPAIWLVVGALAPILLSIVYFTARGSLSAYIDFGLLYNFRYAGSWQPQLYWPAAAPLFSLPSKAVIMAFGLLVLTGLGRIKIITRRLQFALAWFWLALFASLLSNRPYPHYFIQVMPALCLSLGLIGEEIRTLSSRRLAGGLSILTGTATVSLFVLVLIALQAGLYPTVIYYQRFFQLMTGQMTTLDYYQSFNHLMTDNYVAAQLIREANQEKLFIWGTNPMLYALSETSPTGRFTVSFHIKDFQAYDETLRDLQTHAPLFIVVMNEEHGQFPGFYEYLNQEYIPNYTFEHFTLWKRFSEV